MIVRYVSDLHIEFGYELELESLEEDKDSILILAGDIHNLDKIDSILEEVSKRFKKVIYVPGNHEYYGLVFNRAFHKARVRNEHLENVYFLNNEYTLIDDWVFIGSTLWTDTSDCPMAYDLSDYKYIRYIYDGEEKAITPKVTTDVHLLSVRCIKDILGYYPEKNVFMVSHHAPSAHSSSIKFIDSPMNECFYTNLENLILDNPQIKYWVHGHMHNGSDYKIGECRVLCNPRGYKFRAPRHLDGVWENTYFDDRKRLAI